MAQTNVSIRMDENLKKQFDAFCSEIGMSMTTAFCVFAKTVVRERRIPFEIKADVPNADTINAMNNVLNGVGMSKEFTSVKDLMEDLNAED
ncbi:MAG: type II toxin-antitoxin system RelB/DinJ family antitoxin [Ruminococcus bromii]|nr:type II toxin-antitoxin system RelB/DinJ family antitoxin [Ruminococcus bromii]